MNKSDSTIYSITEQLPSFVGGEEAMYKFIQENIVYPQEAKKAKISGVCYIAFTVEKDGQLSNIRVLRGVNNGKMCDEEAVRCVSIMPKWIPGKQNGKTVRVQFNLPFKFSLR